MLVKGYTEEELVEALRYILDGRGFCMGYLGIFIDWNLYRNEYIGYLLGVKVAGT